MSSGEKNFLKSEKLFSVTLCSRSVVMHYKQITDGAEALINLRTDLLQVILEVILSYEGLRKSGTDRPGCSDPKNHHM